MTPDFFFQVFVKNSLIKNIILLFKQKKSLRVEHNFFLENSSQLGVFWLRQGLQANHRTTRKREIFPQPSNQKQLHK